MSAGRVVRDLGPEVALAAVVGAMSGMVFAAGAALVLGTGVTFGAVLVLAGLAVLVLGVAAAAVVRGEHREPGPRLVEVEEVSTSGRHRAQGRARR